MPDSEADASEGPAGVGDDEDEEGLEEWEELDEPIDDDIDEGDYVAGGHSLINTEKVQMMEI